jgi:hypothetical protein
MTAGLEEAPLNSSPSPAEVLCWMWPKNYHQESTEEELRKESMNVIQSVKSEEQVSGEVVEGSGTEPKEQKVEKVEKITINDVPKTDVKPEAKSAPKKAKSEKKKSKKRSKKPKISEEKSDESASKKPTKEIEPKSLEIIEKTSSTESSIEAEEQIGGDKILKFESSESVKQIEEKPIEEKPKEPLIVSKEEEKEQEKSKESDDKSLLDVDEEKVRELAKFQNNKHGKEPLEIEGQQDDTVLRFEDVTSSKL